MDHNSSNQSIDLRRTESDSLLEGESRREMYTSITNIQSEASPSPETPVTFNLESDTNFSETFIDTAINTSRTLVPSMQRDGSQSIITQQPLSLRFNSDLPSPASFVTGQPQSLFVQALAKLNENSLSAAVMNHFRKTQLIPNDHAVVLKTELSPPSQSNAPPSYSFVLRQMAVRRRPRIVGTFIPSPSFIQHTPPPNYAAAFDIYVDNPLPRPATRVYNFGFTPMLVICPSCGHAGMSIVQSKITLCTHLCAVGLCMLCCWVCAPLPYILRSCKDVYHYCGNCRNFLGMYCPSSPNDTFS